MPTKLFPLLSGADCVSFGYHFPSLTYYIINPADCDLGTPVLTTYGQSHLIRIPALDIPTGQVIQNARLHYASFGDFTGLGCYGRIRGELSLNPSIPPTFADMLSRPRTITTIDWNDIPIWYHAESHATTNFADVINEIITQPGWLSGNPILLFIDDLDFRSDFFTNATRHGYAYSVHWEYRPFLEIQYGPEKNFAPLDISYTPSETSLRVTLETNIPCHLTCYWTDVRPVRHRRSRILRGLPVPWGTYFCFVAWHPVEQNEPGDTLFHTFDISPLEYCMIIWFTFRGTALGIESPSIGCLFKHHFIPWYTTAIQASKDTWLNKITPNANFGADRDMRVSNYIRPYFPVSAVIISLDTSSIPESATVISADLRLSFFAQSSHRKYHTVYKLTTIDWHELEASYNSPKAGDVWAAGQFSSADWVITDPPGPTTMIPAGIGGQVHFDITQIVQDAIRTPGSLTNLVALSLTPSIGSVRYDSRSALLPSDRPLLTITYQKDE